MRIVNCCNPRGCDDFFGGKFARRVAAKYRKRGLDKAASRIVSFLEREGVADASVLEIGGGVGERVEQRVGPLCLVRTYNHSVTR